MGAGWRGADFPHTKHREGWKWEGIEGEMQGESEKSKWAEMKGRRNREKTKEKRERGREGKEKKKREKRIHTENIMSWTFSKKYSPNRTNSVPKFQNRPASEGPGAPPNFPNLAPRTIRSGYTPLFIGFYNKHKVAKCKNPCILYNYTLCFSLQAIHTRQLTSNPSDTSIRSHDHHNPKKTCALKGIGWLSCESRVGLYVL